MIQHLDALAGTGMLARVLRDSAFDGTDPVLNRNRTSSHRTSQQFSSPARAPLHERGPKDMAEPPDGSSFARPLQGIAQGAVIPRPAVAMAQAAGEPMVRAGHGRLATHSRSTLRALPVAATRDSGAGTVCRTRHVTPCSPWRLRFAAGPMACASGDVASGPIARHQGRTGLKAPQTGTRPSRCPMPGFRE